jgi:crotonobetainyl-CoA:carnitine CoA-transferase CaiB-like acyl-CoA transferase
VYHWQRELLGKVPTAPVQELRDVPNHPQVIARQNIVAGEASWGPAYKPGAPFRFDGHIASQPRAPHLDEHRYKILKEDLGYSDEDIARDEAEGAFSKRRP